MAGVRIDDLSKTDDGRVLIAIRERGLKRFLGNKLATYPIRSASVQTCCFRIGMSIPINCCVTAMEVSGSDTHLRGIIHLHQGQTKRHIYNGRRPLRQHYL